MKDVMVEGFVLLNTQQGVCPSRFVISANRYRLPAEQRTLCRHPQESDGALWIRVLANLRDMAVRSDPFDPLSSTYGGVIECFYDCPLSEGEYARDDARQNLLAVLRMWARAPGQPFECQEFAIDFLERYESRTLQ